MAERRNWRGVIYAVLVIPAIVYWFLVFFDIQDIWPLPDQNPFLDARDLYLMMAALLLSLSAWGVAIARKYHLAVILATWTPVAHAVVYVLTLV